MVAKELRALLVEGRYLAALREAGAVARDATQVVEDRTEAALIAAGAALALEMYAEAAEFGQMARTWASEPDTVARALYYLGSALVFYDEQEAEGVLLAALAQDDTPFLRRARPAILHNLALVYERRRDAVAIDVYQQAAAGFLALGQANHAMESYQNAAWLALLSGDTSSGQVLLGLARQHFTGADSARRVHQQALESYAHFLAGDRLAAVTLVEELLQPGRHDVTPWARTLAAIVGAEISMAEGQFTLARGMLQIAGETLTRSRCPKLANLLADVRRRLLAKGGTVECGGS